MFILVSCQTLLIEIPKHERVDVERAKKLEDKEKIRLLIEGIIELESNRSFILYQLRKANGRRIKVVE